MVPFDERQVGTDDRIDDRFGHLGTLGAVADFNHVGPPDAADRHVLAERFDPLLGRYRGQIGPQLGRQIQQVLHRAFQHDGAEEERFVGRNQGLLLRIARGAGGPDIVPDLQNQQRGAGFVHAGRRGVVESAQQPGGQQADGHQLPAAAQHPHEPHGEVNGIGRAESCVRRWSLMYARLVHGEVGLTGLSWFRRWEMTNDE